MTEETKVEEQEVATEETTTEAVAETTTEEETSTEATTPEASEELAEDDGRDPLLAQGDSPDFKWYIAKTLTGQENKVSKTLRENIVNHKLTEYFSQILVPEETVTSHAGGRKRTIKKKFFPGYVLIKMIMNDNAWHLVKNTEKITGFVGGTSDKPMPISDEEAEYMTSKGTGGPSKTRTTVDFSEGDQVKVTEGPFASFVGTVEAVTEKKIKVNVSIFGRPTPVELEFNQVEKVG